MFLVVNGMVSGWWPKTTKSWRTMDNETDIYSVRWTAEAPRRSPSSVTYHVRQLDVGEAVDQRLAQVGQLVQERLVLLLNDFILLLNRLQVALHCGDLKSHIWVTCNTRQAAGSMLTVCEGRGCRIMTEAEAASWRPGFVSSCLYIWAFGAGHSSNGGVLSVCSPHWMFSSLGTLIRPSVPDILWEP